MKELITLPSVNDLTVTANPHANPQLYGPNAYSDLFARDESLNDLNFQMLRSSEQDKPFYLLDWHTELDQTGARRELIDFGTVKPPTVYDYDNIIPDVEDGIEHFKELNEFRFAIASLLLTRSMRVWRDNGNGQSLMWRRPFLEFEKFSSKFIAFMDTTPLELFDLIKRTRSTQQPLTDLEARLQSFDNVYNSNISNVHSK